VVLGLLANVALHAAMFSGGFAFVYAMEFWQARRKGAARPAGWRLGLAAVTLLAFYALAIATAKPAKDITFPQGQSPLPAPQARRVEQLARLRHGHSLHAIAYQLEQRLAPLASGLVFPLAAALLFWAIFAWALFKEGMLRYLIPGVFFALFCHFVTARPWHSGLMMPYVVVVLWMVWPARERRFDARAGHEQSALGAFFLIVLVQIYWAAHALTFDRTHAYSPGRQTAAFLRPYVDRGASILETGNHFDSVTLEPYFDRKIFANEPYAFYWWSKRNEAEEDYSSMVRQQPAMVLVQWLADGDTWPTPEAINLIPEVPELRTLGYRNTHVFCGQMPVQGAVILESHCELVFERPPNANHPLNDFLAAPMR
jgi:hypothetical protein